MEESLIKLIEQLSIPGQLLIISFWYFIKYVYNYIADKNRLQQNFKLKEYEEDIERLKEDIKTKDELLGQDRAKIKNLEAIISSMNNERIEEYRKEIALLKAERLKLKDIN